MSIIEFLVAGLTAIIFLVYIRIILYGGYKNEMLKYVEKLSKDKDPEPFHGGYIIYANGSRWFLRNWVTWELYWIPEATYKTRDFEKMITNDSLEFFSTWLPTRKMYKSVRRIIYTHPNLEAKGFWKVVQFFNFV